jgi:hypothetical protein
MGLPLRDIWKETDKWIFTTGDHYASTELVEFNNVAFREYYSDITVDINRFEDVFITQLGLKGSLSLYMHTKDGEFVGFSRTCK